MRFTGRVASRLVDEIIAMPDGLGIKEHAVENEGDDTDKTELGEAPKFSAMVLYTRDETVVEKNRDMEAQAKADVAVSTRKVERAMEALDAGKPEEAEQQLDEARDALNASPAAASGSGSMLREQHYRQ